MEIQRTVGRAARLLVYVWSGCVLVACGAEGREVRSDLTDVRDALVARYPTAEKVSVSLSGTYLDLVLVNCGFDGLPDDAQVAKAQEVARDAIEAYPKAAELEHLGVTFHVHRRFLVFSFNSNMATHRFDMDELVGGSTGVPPEPGVEQRPGDDAEKSPSP